MTKQMWNPFKLEMKAFRFPINPADPAGDSALSSRTRWTGFQLNWTIKGPSVRDMFYGHKHSRHGPVKTGYPIIQQEQLIISSNGDETMVPCCSELPLYSIHASCWALFAHLPYLKGLQRQRGSAECGPVMVSKWIGNRRLYHHYWFRNDRFLTSECDGP